MLLFVDSGHWWRYTLVMRYANPIPVLKESAEAEKTLRVASGHTGAFYAAETANSPRANRYPSIQ